MTTIAITGGIGSGKSHLARIIAAEGCPIFYADDEAKRILRSDRQVQDELSQLLGESILAPDGTLRKALLAAYLCQGKEHSRKIDAIVHPRVLQAWQQFCAERSTAPQLFVECALLFESGFDRYVDKVLIVSCEEEERIRRVMQRDGCDRATVLQWMALQMPEAEKQSRSTWIVRSSSESEERRQLSALGILP